MDCYSSCSKEQVIDLTSSPVSKRTIIRPMTLTTRDSRLFWIFSLSPTTLRVHLLWWKRLYNLTPLDPPSSLRYLWIRIGQTCLETLRISLTNWSKNSTRTHSSLELNWSAGFEERILSSLWIILRRFFTLIVQRMWKFHHMMID